LDESARQVALVSTQIKQARRENASAYAIDQLSARLSYAIENLVARRTDFNEGVINYFARALAGSSKAVSDLKADFAGASVSISTFDPKLRIGRISASEAVEGRAVGFPIFDSDIRNLEHDDRYWKDFVTNRFSVNGGSAQYVVVRDGLVVYRQKSLDFDPTPVAGAGTAIAKLGLRIAAAQAVGSFGRMDTSAESPQLVDQSVVNLSELRTMEQSIAVRKNALLQLLNSLSDLYERIGSNANPSDSDLEQYRESLQSILAFYQGQLKAVEVSND
jgi:hypothetical protein